MLEPGAMTVQDDDLVRIDPNGQVHPMGASAAVRFQARAGLFQVLPSPSHLLVLRQRVEGESESRSCRLSGEIAVPGILSDVLGLCTTAGWEGELVVFDEAGTRSIFVSEGTAVGATTTMASERLGQVLYRYGVLDEKQVEACLASAVASSRFGEAAVKLGLVKREKLFEMIGRQIEEIVRGALLVTHGYFYFLDGFDASVLPARHALSLSGLVRDGVRWMHEARYFQSRIPSSRHVPVATGAAASAGGGGADRVHGAIDGVRSVAEIGRVLGMGELDVTRALFELAHQGRVLIEPPRLAPEEAAVACNSAISLIFRELDALDRGDEVRAQLAEFARKTPYPMLFAKAGPRDDGSYDVERIAKNAAGHLAPDALAGALREYAGYAMFLARPHLQRAHARQDSTRLSRRVAALLEPIEPAARGSR
jgi:hypothetical protein